MPECTCAFGIAARCGLRGRRSRASLTSEPPKPPADIGRCRIKWITTPWPPRRVRSRSRRWIYRGQRAPPKRLAAALQLPRDDGVVERAEKGVPEIFRQGGQRG